MVKTIAEMDMMVYRIIFPFVECLLPNHKTIKFHVDEIDNFDGLNVDYVRLEIIENEHKIKGLKLSGIFNRDRRSEIRNILLELQECY